MLDEPRWFIAICEVRSEAGFEGTALMVSEPGQGAADEAEGFAGSGGRFEYADFALFEARVDGVHELELDFVGLVGVMEVPLIICICCVHDGE